MAPKYHPTPLSGGDRKALTKELSKARAMANILAVQSAEMRAKGENPARVIEMQNLSLERRVFLFSLREGFDLASRCRLRRQQKNMLDTRMELENVVEIGGWLGHVAREIGHLARIFGCISGHVVFGIDGPSDGIAKHVQSSMTEWYPEIMIHENLAEALESAAEADHAHCFGKPLDQ